MLWGGGGGAAVGRLLEGSRTKGVWAEDWNGYLERHWLAMDRFKSLITSIVGYCRRLRFLGGRDTTDVQI